MNQARLLKNFQMEGQARLTRFKGIGQFAHAALAIFQTLENLEPSLIRERMEPYREGLLAMQCVRGHDGLIHQHLLIYQVLSGLYCVAVPTLLW